jgi:hypothetical protein
VGGRGRPEYAELLAGADGVYHSRVFPGLDLDARALVELDGLKVLETLQHGLARPEHAAFIRKSGSSR